jgi:hypothetical protein
MERPIPVPTGTVADITKIRSVTARRFREQQPQINEPSSDTIPGKGSGDE